VNLEHGIDPLYRPGAAYMAHDSTWKSIRKLKDKYGNPIWQRSLVAGAPDMINGYLRAYFVAVGTLVRSLFFPGGFRASRPYPDTPRAGSIPVHRRLKSKIGRGPRHAPAFLDSGPIKPFFGSNQSTGISPSEYADTAPEGRRPVVSDMLKGLRHSPHQAERQGAVLLPLGSGHSSSTGRAHGRRQLSAH
jgi:hypothetical protein